MRNTAKFATTALSLAALLAGMSAMPGVASAADEASIKMGKEVAYDRRLGNCLACHMMGDGASPGNIGPPLIAMKARFPDRDVLQAQIWDPTVSNPSSRMPPFGKYKALSPAQIDAIVDYLYTL